MYSSSYNIPSQFMFPLKGSDLVNIAWITFFRSLISNTILSSIQSKFCFAEFFLSNGFLKRFYLELDRYSNSSYRVYITLTRPHLNKKMTNLSLT